MEAKMGRSIVSMARQTGKTTYQQQLIDHMARQIRDGVDKHILDTLYGKFGGGIGLNSYHIIKKWRNRRGEVMRRINAGYEVREWLKNEHSQYGISNPEWWLFDGGINISDRLFSLLVLQYDIEN
jgi:hypothetical protein